MSRPITSARVRNLRESPSVAAAQRVRELKADGREILDLTVGEPDFDTPDTIKAAAVTAMERGLTKYTPVNGIPELRAAIVADMASRTGITYSDKEITVGGGAKQVIFMALMATVEPGVEVIIPAPYWVSYPDMVEVHGGTPVIVNCAEHEGFRLTAAALERAITPSTRWLLLNAPSNPTGALYTADELSALAEVLRAHPHVSVLCDHIYDRIVYDGAPVDILRVAPDLRDRVLAVNGVSKAYAMTGWRLGYATGRPDLIGAINKLQSQSSSCPSSISQFAAAEALTGDQTFVEHAVKVYQERRDLAVELFADIDGLYPVTPGGAFYLFVRCDELIGRRRPDGTVVKSDSDVVLHLLDDAGVATIPGAAYGAPGYFRVSFATSDGVIRRAAHAVVDAVASLS